MRPRDGQLLSGIDPWVNMGRPSLEKQPAESITSREEHQDHKRDDQRDGADHREYRGAFVVHLAASPRLDVARTLAWTPSADAPSSAARQMVQQVADEVDRARREHRRVLTPLARPALCLGQRPPRLRLANHCIEAKLARQRLQRRGRQGTAARGGGEPRALADAAAARASMLAASLSSSTPSTRPPGERRTARGSDSTSARAASGLCAPSSTVSGSSPTTCKRPGTTVAAAASRTASSRSSIPARAGTSPRPCERARNCAAETSPWRPARSLAQGLG